MEENIQMFCIAFGSCYEDVREIFLYHPKGMSQDDFNELCGSICGEFLKTYNPQSIWTKYDDICDHLEKELIEKHGFCYPEWRTFFLDEEF